MNRLRFSVSSADDLLESRDCEALAPHPPEHGSGALVASLSGDGGGLGAKLLVGIQDLLRVEDGFQTRRVFASRSDLPRHIEVLELRPPGGVVSSRCSRVRRYRNSGSQRGPRNTAMASVSFLLAKRIRSHAAVCGCIALVTGRPLRHSAPNPLPRVATSSPNVDSRDVPQVRV
jgi:hypothetical protein